ncbi:MAG: hypothetical protein DLM72_14500 [Candidatus Nitrosopolaris wilkensis]|nr:MAG: hypothetical protein DLM72_14500 [Candidatus Nitrosopolaris wilkensis]
MSDVKVETKFCQNCTHHYQDHFTDSRKQPRTAPGKHFGKCNLMKCCYGKCSCNEFIAGTISIPYEEVVEYAPHGFIRIDHCDVCKKLDYEQRARGAAKEPNYVLEDFASRFTEEPIIFNPNMHKQLEDIDKQILELTKRTKKNRLEVAELLRSWQ